jgi:hypothetical protein
MIGYDNYSLLETLFIMLIIVIHALYVEWIVQCICWNESESFKLKNLLLNGHFNNKGGMI